jgi:hypothetical protein
MTQPFLARLERQSGLARLNECFPLQILSVEAPETAFYEFYGPQSVTHTTIGDANRQGD